jgi:hypothetical protein
MHVLSGSRYNFELDTSILDDLEADVISTLTTSVMQLYPVAATSSVAAIFLLIGLLVARELAASGGPRLRIVARNLAIGIAPLLVAFVAICIHRLFEVL